MKLLQTAFIVLVLLLNLVIAPPSWAGSPDLTQSPDYTEVTQAIDHLLQIKNTSDQTEYTPEEIQKKLGDLKLQKYILETAQDWAQCRNETGKTLGVYAHKAKKSLQQNTLYFLGNGQVTDNDWNCDGIYLPTGSLVADLGQELTEPIAIKIVDGTQLVAKANPETGAIEFNVPPAKVFKTGEGTWSIPNFSQADIDANVPNAPIED
jgi:hypothetical protein